MASDMARAQILNIKKRYGKNEVLRGLSMEAVCGQCTGLLGTNGTGKSTLLRILAGTLQSDSGTFLWQGADLLRDGASRSKTVAYVPQGTPLIEELSARDNLRLWYEKDAMEQSLENGVLRELGIQEFLKTTAGRLSGGMKKRLSIGCAIANHPSILLLDEPTAALDLVCKERILDYFDHFRKQGGLLIMATHDLWELEMCDRWYLLSDGVANSYSYDGDPRSLVRSLDEG